MAKKPTKAQLEKQRAKATNALWELQRIERIKTNSRMIGRCFKYRNSYGSSDEGWWLYIRIVDVDENGWLSAFSVQTTSQDEIQIRPLETRMSLSDSYEAIPDSEFLTALADTKARIASLDGSVLAKTKTKPSRHTRWAR